MIAGQFRVVGGEWSSHGLSVDAWLLLHSVCYVQGVNGPMRAAWPDGGAALDQPAIVVAVFELIDDEMAKEAEASA